jgi:hypothetical protein
MAIPLHVIDVRTTDGLLDIIALGNIIEFATALDIRSYVSVGIDNDEQLEQEAAMTHYREFMRWFSRNYGLLIDDAWTSAMYLFKRRLISFGATVTNYFAREHATTQRQDRMQSITPATVAKKFRRHIEKCYLDVLPAFDKLLTKSSSFLCYIGPPIRIIPKTEIRLFQEKLSGCIEDKDYPGAPIYLPADPIPDPAPLPDPAALKRAHVPTSGPSSPSQEKVVKRRRDVDDGEGAM